MITLFAFLAAGLTSFFVAIFSLCILSVLPNCHDRMRRERQGWTRTLQDLQEYQGPAGGRDSKGGGDEERPEMGGERGGRTIYQRYKRKGVGK